MGCLLSGAQAEALWMQSFNITWDRGGGILEEVVGWRLLMMDFKVLEQGR